jgi:ABC-type glycerol-3-phosphate transport system substrate-binding protein
MADSFTIYGMPLTTSSFYDSFRYGSLPVGVSNFETYIKLLTAAPEIVGLWGIDLYPATVLPDGTQNRYATGSAQASIMFAKTDRPNEAWEFMKWWMSTETQIDFPGAADPQLRSRILVELSQPGGAPISASSR